VRTPVRPPAMRAPGSRALRAGLGFGA
jgi:hypothetical protein